MVQLVLDESAEVLRAERGVLITRTHHGLVCANAGVDRSNVPGDDLACLLPVDPDASARRLRAALPERPAVVIADSFGRAWRLGQADVAIGCAGLVPLDDRRGRTDHDGRELTATIDAVADQAASAAALARDKAGREAVVVVRGLERYVIRRRRPRSGRDHPSPRRRPVQVGARPAEGADGTNTPCVIKSVLTAVSTSPSRPPSMTCS